MEQAVQIIRDDLVLVDWGPMTMTISAWQKGQARPVIAARAARRAMHTLAILADFQRYLRKPVEELPVGRPLPPVVGRALAAARAMDGGLTPLAAVAGAAADEVADFAFSLGADRVLVNNGGDIALRLGPGQSSRVGVRPPAEADAEPRPLLGRLNLGSADGVGGVASSGWQGRSLSSGVADLVTVWAAGASLADAAATLIAGVVRPEGAGVEMATARSVDPDSDLGDMPITRRVGRLSRAQKLDALAQGQKLALELFRRGLIMGCLLELQGELALLDLGRLCRLPGADSPSRIGQGAGESSEAKLTLAQG